MFLEVAAADAAVCLEPVLIGFDSHIALWRQTAAPTAIRGGCGHGEQVDGFEHPANLGVELKERLGLRRAAVTAPISEFAELSTQSGKPDEARLRRIGVPGFRLDTIEFATMPVADEQAGWRA